MDRPTDDVLVPPNWMADLTASKAEIKRGETVAMSSVLEGMQAAIDRIESRDADRRRQA